MAFEATAGTGGSLTIDASGDVGGAELGPSPMELLLLGLAGCTGMSVLSLLRRSTGKVVDYRVATRGQQRAAHPVAVIAVPTTTAWAPAAKASATWAGCQ